MILNIFNKGSALTEFAVLTLVMVPLFSMIPLLGKISDVNHTVVQASRYAAWERTVADPSRKSEGALSLEVNNRFFAKTDLAIRSNEGSLSGEDAQNVLWTGFGENEEKTNRLLITGSGNILASTRNMSLPKADQSSFSLDLDPGKLSKSIAKVGDVMDGLISNAKWDIEGKGLYRATVNANVRSNTFFPGGGSSCNGESSGKIFTCIRRQNAILVDSWSSGSSEQSEERTRALVPAGTLEELGGLLSYMGKVPFLNELGNLEDSFGYVNSDVLPSDRKPEQ